MLIGEALTKDKSDAVQDMATNIDGGISEELAKNKYGRTIY